MPLRRTLACLGTRLRALRAQGLGRHALLRHTRGHARLTRITSWLQPQGCPTRISGLPLALHVSLRVPAPRSRTPLLTFNFLLPLVLLSPSQRILTMSYYYEMPNFDHSHWHQPLRYGESSSGDPSGPLQDPLGFVMPEGYAPLPTSFRPNYYPEVSVSTLVLFINIYSSTNCIC